MIMPGMVWKIIVDSELFNYLSHNTPGTTMVGPGFRDLKTPKNHLTYKLNSDKKNIYVFTYSL